VVKIHSAKSRIRAALVNSGRYTIEEAERKLASMKIRVHLGEDVASTPAGQAAALTAIMTAVRSFDRVLLDGFLDVPLILRLSVKGKTMREVGLALGAVLPDAGESAPRSVLIGAGGRTGNGQEVNAIWNGWSAGVAPAASKLVTGRSDCALAGIGAGALAVGQCFLAEQGDVRAGRRTEGVSLWEPDAEDWWAASGPPLADVYLPTALWLIGLGNLGQAYVWSLTWLPYGARGQLTLFLQDFDRIGEENWGTSILVRRKRYGDLKTFVAEDWCLKRGFKVQRIDRCLDGTLKRGDNEPGFAIAGLDRMEPRRLLGGSGFIHILDAGLGADVSDYHQIRVSAFDENDRPEVRWAESTEQAAYQARKAAEREQALKSLKGYQEHTRKSKDACGTAELMGIPVAVPFVGAFAGAVTVAQSVRIASGLAPYSNVCGSLSAPGLFRAELGKAPERIRIGNVKAGVQR
jgi:hypothetical protein